MNADARYSRQEALFGAEGQARLAGTSVAILGLGGLGSHVAQQLAYLGIRSFLLIDGDAVSPSNLNRVMGASERDVASPKVEVARAMVETIQPDSQVTTDARRLVGTESQPHDFPDVDAVFGCVDDDTPRLDLVRLCSAYALTYIDLASDVATGGEFGGRVVFAKDGERCLSCLGELDQHVLARAQMTEEQRAADDRIYGVERDALSGTGPSVVSVNGVVASLAVTEFLMWVTGLREPFGYLNYRADRGTVGTRADPDRRYCHYCMTLWGSGASGAGA